MTSLSIVEPLVGGHVHQAMILPKLRYLIPMARNHVLGLDKVPFVDLLGAEVPDVARRAMVTSTMNPERSASDGE